MGYAALPRYNPRNCPHARQAMHKGRRVDRNATERAPSPTDSTDRQSINLSSKPDLRRALHVKTASSVSPTPRRASFPAVSKTAISRPALRRPLPLCARHSLCVHDCSGHNLEYAHARAYQPQCADVLWVSGSSACKGIAPHAAHARRRYKR